jgi:hypothetical protein
MTTSGNVYFTGVLMHAIVGQGMRYVKVPPPMRMAHHTVKWGVVRWFSGCPEEGTKCVGA